MSEASVFNWQWFFIQVDIFVFVSDNGFMKKPKRLA
jgi:hypothetical protein